MQITLKPWSVTDKDNLTSLCNAVDRRYLSDRLPQPYTSADADFWLGMVCQAEIDHTGVFRAIVADGHIVGSISAEQQGDIFRIDAEIGYMILTEYWNRGIATQAIGEIVSIAFKNLNINRITAKVFEGNKASAKVLTKNGFALEGCLKNAAVKNGMIDNVLIFGLLR